MTRRKAGSGRSGGGRPPDGPARVGSLLDGVFRKLGLTEEVARQEALARWEQVVGEGVARVTRASAVSGGVLFVKVSSSAWLTELNVMRHEILARLNAGRTEGRIERIVFTLAETPWDVGGCDREGRE